MYICTYTYTHTHIHVQIVCRAKAATSTGASKAVVKGVEISYVCIYMNIRLVLKKITKNYLVSM